MFLETFILDVGTSLFEMYCILFQGIDLCKMTFLHFVVGILPFFTSFFSSMKHVKWSKKVSHHNAVIFS